jgi:hypothetical protein
MATTPNYGWVMPDPTDFVTNLPADFEVFGDAVDATVKTVADTADAAIPETLIDAAGDLIYGSAADTAARLAIGTAGQVLLVNGGATAPEWGTVAADSMTVIASGTLSGAQVDLTSIPGTFKNLQLVIRNYLPVSNAAVQVRFNADTGTNYLATNTSVAANTTAQAFAQTSLQISGLQNLTTSDATIIFDAIDYANTTTWKTGRYLAITNDTSTSTSLRHRQGISAYNGTGAITEINLFNSSGDFTSGSYILYGVK